MAKLKIENLKVNGGKSLVKLAPEANFIIISRTNFALGD